MKQTNLQELNSLKVKQPNRFIYNTLMFFVGKIFKKKYGIKFTYNVDLKKYKGKPLIVVSNHSSRQDWVFVGLAIGKARRLNFVAAQNEFFRSHLAFIFRLMHIIPKKNFAPDMLTVRSMSKIMKKKEGTIAIFPAGMNSIWGAQQPSAIGSGKMLLHYGAPVVIVKIKGGFMMTPKYTTDERCGTVEVEVSELFTPEDLKGMTEKQVQLKLDEALFQDDFEWNKVHGYTYDCHGESAYRLHHLLYRCPKCGKEFTMVGRKNIIECKACGNSATLSDSYELKATEGSTVPESISKWFDEERRICRKLVEDENFILQEHVRLGAIPEYGYLTDQKTCLPVGEGTLTLTRKGLDYEGTRDGKPYSFHVDSANLPTYGMCVDLTFFYTYATGEYLQFDPDGETTAKWLLCTEEVHRVNGGKWQNYPWFEY